ncbi:hypothetical protein CLV51_102645 [Chitinophaga niastensis]|uniref:Lipocalin-like protein n=1 Tax=Chitinophaga niastensis TaxID=536980 RepID=A0A2P8HNJ2_CHINA|nr:hypothetical protein [Chitinophaga niastensis]PSL47785.1 hypothetical protein CLV51_102645 [Chitinophaga niastensis]
MKTWFYLPLLLLGFILPGCTKTTNEVVIPNKTILVDIKSTDWKQVNGVWGVTFIVPELDNSTNQTDGVIVSMSRGNAVFEILPEVYQDQSYTVIHNPGNIVVELRGTDGRPTIVPAENITFKLVLIPSSQIQ